MTSSLVSLVAAAEVPELEENHIFMPAWGYGLVALSLFLLLFLFLWSFRNTAARYVQRPTHTHHKANH